MTESLILFFILGVTNLNFLSEGRTYDTVTLRKLKNNELEMDEDFFLLRRLEFFMHSYYKVSIV
jgi:hypothetical protein